MIGQLIFHKEKTKIVLIQKEIPNKDLIMKNSTTLKVKKGFLGETEKQNIQKGKDINLTVSHLETSARMHKYKERH